MSQPRKPINMYLRILMDAAEVRARQIAAITSRVASERAKEATLRKRLRKARI